jgi:hypothetical protein
VWCKTRCARTRKKTATQIGAYRPRILPLPKWLDSAGGIGAGRYEPPLIRSPKPNVIPNVPSVTMNGGRRSFVMSVPLISPHVVPARMQTAIPAGIAMSECGY